MYMGLPNFYVGLAKTHTMHVVHYNVYTSKLYVARPETDSYMCVYSPVLNRFTSEILWYSGSSDCGWSRTT